MSIKRINELPEGSGSLSNDDIFLFMDNPSGTAVTKKISLSEIASAASAAAPVQSVNSLTGSVVINTWEVPDFNIGTFPDMNFYFTATKLKQYIIRNTSTTNNTSITYYNFLDPPNPSGGDYYVIYFVENSQFTRVGGVSNWTAGTRVIRLYKSGSAGGWSNIVLSPITQSDLDKKAPINNPTFTGTVSGITKSMVGLGNADNTSDVNKPVSTAQASADAAVQAYSIQRSNHTGTQSISTIDGLQLALDSKQTSGSYATLVDGKVPAFQLPSYVDDVLEYADFASLPNIGETGKIYVTLDSNKTYRWSGSTYIEISPSPGSTDSISEGSVNKYYTDIRASGAAPVQSVAGRIGDIILTKNDVGLANVDNTSDANKPISTATQTALNGKASLVDGKVPAAQLPSYVDDVLEYANLASLPVTGESGKIYVALDSNKVYRWGGSSYLEISPSPAGVTSNISGITGASGINNIVSISQADYDSITTKDPNTLYIIV